MDRDHQRRGSINIKDGEILAGELPRKQLHLVQAWIEIHRDELNADWELCQWREPLQDCSPVRSPCIGMLNL
ncbi:MAG: DUF4160 domain-containing protein [Candidatus Competibacter sp.]|nr:DUF4160 domain-containing protein [Candidatus Competibacter sp.]